MYNFRRIINMINNTKGQVLVKSDSPSNKNDCYIPPTLVLDIDKNDPIMQQEVLKNLFKIIKIFGPVLPILVVNNLEEAIEITNSLYILDQFIIYFNKVINL